MTLPRRLGILALSAALVAAGSACGGNANANAACNTDADLAARQTLPIPPILAGLTVSVDTKATSKIAKAAASNSYVCNAMVFAMRDGKELRAVLQVARLTPDARPGDPKFRRTIAGQIGGTSRRPEKIGDTLVYRARVNSQIIDIWFTGQFMEVLIALESDTAGGTTIDFGRLLAEAISLRPIRV
ncbi:MAG: hypothetical protein WDA27_10080 [Actinomycetota bacterium]